MGLEKIGGQAARNAAKMTEDAARIAVQPGFWRGLAQKLGLIRKEAGADAVTISKKATARGGEAVATIVGDLQAGERLPVSFDVSRYRFLETNAQERSSASYWLIGDKGERALFKEPRHVKTDKTGTPLNPEAGNERLAAVLGEQLRLPVNRVQLGTFNGKAGSLHHDVGRPEQPAVSFLRVTNGFGVRMRRGSGHPYRSMSTYDRTGEDLAAHWHKLQQFFTNPEIWDRTDFFDRTINNLRHGENYLLAAEGGKFKVFLIDNSGAFDGQIADGRIPSLTMEINEYKAYLESLLVSERAPYLRHILPDMQRFAALPPAMIKADLAEIPEQFLPFAYRESARNRLLQKQQLVREFLDDLKRRGHPQVH